MTAFVSVPEAAVEAGMSMRHFRRLYVEANAGKFIMIRHHIFIVRSDLKAWMKKRKQG